MNQVLRYVSVIIACAVVLYVIATIKSCNKPSKNITATVNVPTDSNFVPVKQTEYQPPSIPILSKKKSGFKLPVGISERDVKKVTSLEIKSGDSLTTLDVIETNEGEVFVGKDSILKSVSVTVFEKPVFSFGLSYGFGLTAGLRDEKVILSPAVIVSLMDWNISGLHFKTPEVTADLDGIGLGAQLQLYNDIYIGATHSWNYEGSKSMKLSLCFVLK